MAALSTKHFLSHINATMDSIKTFNSNDHLITSHVGSEISQPLPHALTAGWAVTSGKLSSAQRRIRNVLGHKFFRTLTNRNLPAGLRLYPLADNCLPSDLTLGRRKVVYTLECTGARRQIPPGICNSPEESQESRPLLVFRARFLMRALVHIAAAACVRTKLCLSSWSRVVGHWWALPSACFCRSLALALMQLERGSVVASPLRLFQRAHYRIASNNYRNLLPEANALVSAQRGDQSC